MAWGQIFADPGFLNTVTTGLFGEDSRLGQLINLAGVGYGLYDANKKNDQSEARYEDAIKSQQALLALLGKQYSQQTQYDAQLRDRILGQTGALSQSLMNAYNNLGPQPVVNAANVAADYGQIKATKMADFNDLANLVTSQSYANQVSRLGGADSASADAGREAALMKQLTPQLMAIDNDAMNEAYARNSNAVNLYNINRANILNELAGIYAPGISAETNLYRPESTASASSGLLGALGRFAETESVTQQNRATEAQSQLTNLTSILRDLLGGGTQQKTTQTQQTTVPTNAPGGGIGGGQSRPATINDPITWY